eukprot:g977.t1
MMDMIAYNNPNDPLQIDSAHGIASRYDLDHADSEEPEEYDVPRPSGAIDFKVASSKMVRDMLTVTQIGPTHQDHLPRWRAQDMSDFTPMRPFDWNSRPEFRDTPHWGVPKILDFEWQILGKDVALEFPQSAEHVREIINAHEIDL